jgi:hypothetical protein
MFDWLEGANRIAEPFPYNHQFDACGDSEEFLAMLDPANFWIRERQFVPALKIAIARLAGEARGASCLSDTSTFILGPEFEQSLTETGVEQSLARVRALLRACAETVLNLNLGATHALREGPEANQPPVIRIKDQARGMRRDIDYEFHPHYWSTQAGPEFSRVVTHNDYRIAW